VPYQLRFGPRAAASLKSLRDGGPAVAGKLKKVGKALALLQQDPHYPGLHSHQYQRFPGHETSKVWDSYVENRSPAAWRVYWMYGPDEKTEDGDPLQVITVLAIRPHL
jgi:hypothetical protein